MFTIGITVACGDDSPAPTGPTQVTLPPATRTLNTLRVTTSDAEFVDGGQVLSVAETVDLTACAVYSDDTEDCTITATWQSPDSSIATVDNGTVTGIALGEVQIRASYQTASVTMRITVEAAPIGALKHPHIKSGCAETLPTALSAGGGDRDQAEVIAKAMHDGLERVSRSTSRL